MHKSTIFDGTAPNSKLILFLYIFVKRNTSVKHPYSPPLILQSPRVSSGKSRAS